MKLIERLKQFAQARSKARKRFRTYMLIQTLPQEIRKDIGWPEGDRAQDFRRKKH